MTDPDRDYAKYAYHEGARIIQAVQDRISEAAYTGAAPDPDEHEKLCDMLIELHQLLYGATLYPLHEAGDGNDEVYSDGQPVISRVDLTGEEPVLPIPAGAYRDVGGEAVPFGCGVHVWRPGEADYRAEEDGAEPAIWKTAADLRRQGLIDWVRGASGRIEKRSGYPSGRMSPVSAITAAGIARCEEDGAR
jgi:hypothetical protein